MSKKTLPHHDLLDQVQLNVILIVHELPMIQSLLKWVKYTAEGKHPSNPMGWMLLSDREWTHKEQIEKLSQLSNSVLELGKPLRLLQKGINAFSENHKKIERAIFTLNAAYAEIPFIETDIQLMKLGHSLFEDQELTSHFLLFSDKTSQMLKKASNLKQTILDEVIASLSFSTEEETRLPDFY